MGEQKKGAEGSLRVRINGKLARENAELLDALEDLVDIIASAGVHNLVRGVQLGADSWAMKTEDRMERARNVIARAKGEPHA